jgi:hypothetical protein
VERIGRQVNVVDAPTSHGEVQAVAGEMREIDTADLKQPAGLSADRIEHDGRLRAPRHRARLSQRRRDSALGREGSDL